MNETSIRKKPAAQNSKLTIKEIACKLDLSPATVSRALHDPESPFVSRKTRRRVQEAAAQLGYRPNLTGRALATGRTHLISLWINNPYMPYYANIARCLHQESVKRGYHPIIRSVSTLSSEPTHWEAPDGLADGIIASDVREPLLKLLDLSPSLRRPLLSIGVLCVQKVDHVAIDLYAGAVEAVEHLVSTRSGRITALQYRENDPRAVAYHDVMDRAGRADELVIIPDETRSSNRRFIRDYIEARGHPAAFFCHNDDVAIAAYRALCDLGLRVPDDVAIVGCDGIEDTEYLPVPITTIVSPVQEMIAIGWQFLEHRMDEPSAPIQSATLLPKLEIRESSMG